MVSTDLPNDNKTDIGLYLKVSGKGASFLMQNGYPCHRVFLREESRQVTPGTFSWHVLSEEGKENAQVVTQRSEPNPYKYEAEVYHMCSLVHIMINIWILPRGKVSQKRGSRTDCLGQTP